MKTEGTILAIGPTTQISEKFRKREVLIEIAENIKYPQPIMFEAVQDNVALFDQLQVGQEVEVEFDLRGRKWTNREGVDKYFNSLQIWKAKPLHAAPSGPAPYGQQDDIPYNHGQAPAPAVPTNPPPPF